MSLVVIHGSLKFHEKVCSEVKIAFIIAHKEIM